MNLNLVTLYNSFPKEWKIDHKVKTPSTEIVDIADDIFFVLCFHGRDYRRERNNKVFFAEARISFEHYSHYTNVSALKSNLAKLEIFFNKGKFSILGPVESIGTLCQLWPAAKHFEIL